MHELRISFQFVFFFKKYMFFHFYVKKLITVEATMDITGVSSLGDFGRSVNPISIRDTEHAHLITTGTPEFSDLPTALPKKQPQN